MHVENILCKFCSGPFIVNQCFMSKKARRIGNSYLHRVFEWKSIRVGETYRPRTQQRFRDGGVVKKQRQQCAASPLVFRPSRVQAQIKESRTQRKSRSWLRLSGSVLQGADSRLIAPPRIHWRSAVPARLCL
jgi:hypothetical protein